MGTDMATSQDFATWTCGPELDQHFLLYCLRAMRKDLLERLAMGSTHQTIYMPDIKSITIPLPSIQQQRQIVAALQRTFQTLDTTRLELHKQTRLLRERRQALITTAVSGQLNLARNAA
jgi:type I restriction enzyme S subunit